ncbi:hypothetical protein JTE90_012109 [Oedothorax gibbosus]|uniref:Epsilon-sarcoglycan n=1 Tax=Oedothorax gibbosus TaxID=931172 RepID=A0AAV6UXR3_9ARAC|nr:hypothetical protein JTE90_012109 [Oedothorax gibbosus]
MQECFCSVPPPTTVRSTEAFFIPILQEWFPKFHKDDPLEYTASLEGLPDLPHWMFSNPSNSSNAFLYGSADEPGTVHIEIIALNKNTYDTDSTVMELNVEPRERVSSNEVELKFLNLDVGDIFRSGRLKRLEDIFRSSLWRDEEDIYVTSVLSSVDAGGRLPLDPTAKEGVVVRVGGGFTFSRDLEDLGREVQPLRNRSPCPRDYKRTSAEHLFRTRNFIVDWCSFQLLHDRRDKAGSDQHSGHAPSVSLTNGDDGYRPRDNEIPRRDLTFDFVVSVVLPAALVFVVSIVLTCILCYSKDESVAMNHYNSTRSIQGKREEGLIRCDSTPASSFPASCTDSPSSTLPKGCTLRSSGRTSRMQPDPPPYTTNSNIPPSYLGSSRNNLAHQ